MDNIVVQPGFFAPVNKTTDDFIIAHDETVKPEMTYRYYIQYRLLNPLFGADGLGNSDVIKKFALISPGPDKSTPTDKIAIPSRTQIFAADPLSPTLAHFAVFVWSPNPKETLVPAAPGDAILPTSWTLVDIRRDPVTHELYPLLVDDSGKLQRRDLSKDRDDPQKKDIENRAAAAAGAAAAGGVPAPGPGSN